MDFNCLYGGISWEIDTILVREFVVFFMKPAFRNSGGVVSSRSTSKIEYHPLSAVSEFYRSRIFITIIRGPVIKPSPESFNWVYILTPYFFKTHFNIILLSNPRSRKWFLLSDFSPTTFLYIQIKHFSNCELASLIQILQMLTWIHITNI